MVRARSWVRPADVSPVGYRREPCSGPGLEYQVLSATAMTLLRKTDTLRDAVRQGVTGSVDAELGNRPRPSSRPGPIWRVIAGFSIVRSRYGRERPTFERRGDTHRRKSARRVHPSAKPACEAATRGARIPAAEDRVRVEAEAGAVGPRGHAGGRERRRPAHRCESDTDHLRGRVLRRGVVLPRQPSPAQAVRERAPRAAPKSSLGRPPRLGTRKPCRC